MFNTMAPPGGGAGKPTAALPPPSLAEVRKQLLSAVIAERHCSPDLARHLECLEKAHGDETQCVGVLDALGRCQARVYTTPTQLVGIYKEADGRPECESERVAVRRCRDKYRDDPMAHCAGDHIRLNVYGLRAIAGDLGLAMEE